MGPIGRVQIPTHLQDSDFFIQLPVFKCSFWFLLSKVLISHHVNSDMMVFIFQRDKLQLGIIKRRLNSSSRGFQAMLLDIENCPSQRQCPQLILFCCCVCNQSKLRLLNYGAAYCFRMVVVFLEMISYSQGTNRGLNSALRQNRWLCIMSVQFYVQIFLVQKGRLFCSRTSKSSVVVSQSLHAQTLIEPFEGKKYQQIWRQHR